MLTLRYLLAAALFCTVLSAYAEVTEIDNAGLQKLIAAGVPVVDVRTPPEWKMTGVIENSHLLMFFDEKGAFDARAWLEKLAGIAGPDDPVVLICATGGRTRAITHFMDTQAGYNKVYNVTQGIRSWIDARQPVVPVQ